MLSKKNSWIFYDFGNSAFATTVIAGFFPVFFKQFWSAGVSAEVSTARLGIALGIAGLIMAILAPFWGRKSDLSNQRKSWLMSFAALGISATAVLGFVPEGHWAMAIFFYCAAYIGFEASLIFYDSLLPLVTEAKNYNKVSSQGYAFGYLGGGLLFILNVLMVLNPSAFGLRGKVQAIQVSFFTVAFFWAVAAIVLYRGVLESATESSVEKKKLLAIYKDVIQTFKNLMQQKKIFYFLLAYWFYIDGVYTVFTMAVDYGLSIGLQDTDLMKALIVTQLVGFPSALGFGYLSQKFSVYKLLLSCLFVYSLVLLFATQMQTGFDFMILAGLVGLVQGGIQALSRSYFTHLIPQGKSAEYFGFFNVVGRSASVIGPFLVGAVTYFSGSARLGLSSIVLLFIVGAFFLLKGPGPSSDQKAY